jgi:hypothetical protein
MRILLAYALVVPLALAASGQEGKKVQPYTEKFKQPPSAAIVDDIKAALTKRLKDADAYSPSLLRY